MNTRTSHTVSTYCNDTRSLSLSFFSYSSLLSYLILGVENKFFPPFFFVFRSKYRDNLTVLANWLLARSIISFNLVTLEYLYKYSLDVSKRNF